MTIQTASLQSTVARVLESARFKASPTLSRLLRYLADHQDTVAAGRLKAYSIATDVLDQPGDFDPQSNAIVRVYTTRLRTMLARDAATDALESGLALRLPVGGFRLEVVAASADATGYAMQPSLAILPLSNLSGDPARQFLCTGISHEILNLLSQSRQIRVLGADTVFRYRDQPIQPVAAGIELEVDYVLSGTLRAEASSLVMTATLTDVHAGQQVWAQRYERALDHSGILDAQDELAQCVCAVLISMSGAIDSVQRRKASPVFSAYTAVLRFYEYQENYSPPLHAATRDALEHAVQVAPDYAEAWGCLAGTYMNEYMFDFNPQSGSTGPLERAMQAAKRALSLDPGNPLARYAVGTAYYYREDLPAFLNMADEILASTPNRIEIIAGLGLHLANAGQWQRAMPLLDRARALNPGHPSWYWFGYALEAYSSMDYARALSFANRLTMPDFFWEPLYLAMIHGQRGAFREAREALDRCIALRPDLASNASGIVRRVIQNADLAQRCIEGLQKAGLNGS